MCRIVGPHINPGNALYKGEREEPCCYLSMDRADCPAPQFTNKPEKMLVAQCEDHRVEDKGEEAVQEGQTPHAA